MIGTGLIIAGKPVPLLAVTASRFLAGVAVRAFQGTDYLVNRWEGPWVSLGLSSGGGGPGESPTSTGPLHKRGQPVPLVVPGASNSAHGGGRSGAKPRSQRYTHLSIRGKHPKCPPGYVWSYKKKRCVHVHGRGTRWYRKG